jgi:hypothetical protein
MMADYIPFVFGAEDCRMLKNFYSDSLIVRLSLPTQDRTLNNLPQGPGIWIDAGVDGLDKWEPGHKGAYAAYDTFISRFNGYDEVTKPSPDSGRVKGFVESVLDACDALSPKPIWLSVPQLPMVSNASRNKINRLLAQHAAEWKRTRKYVGKLILPLIFTHPKQVNLKTQRKGQLARECYEVAGAQGIWVAESTLNDQQGSGPLEKRFQGLVQFHQELAESLPSDAIKVAGPYWGMNLVLWARGLVQYPAIGLGNAYQYRVPGPAPPRAKERIAVPPLRRLAVASPKLKEWLKEALGRISREEPAYSEFEGLSRYLNQIPLLPRPQASKFYKRWFDSLASVPLSSRALALYQDLSKAFVLGRSLPPLPREEKTARRPDRVAQQLMLNCL